MLTPEQINGRMDHHPPTPAKVAAHEAWRASVKALVIQANDTLPPGRELSLTITHLEDALMWGNAAIARSDGAN